MKTFEERYQAWLEDKLTPAEAAAFEQELPEVSAEELARQEQPALTGLLRKYAAPKLESADFFNYQLQQRLEADLKASQPPEKPVAEPKVRWPLAHLVWGGVCSLLLSAVLYQAWVMPRPELAQKPSAAQPLVAAAGPLRDAQAAAQLPATAPSPGQRATVLEAHGGEGVQVRTVSSSADMGVIYIEGLEALPANYPLQ